MKLLKYIPTYDNNNSFIVYRETKPFTQWHVHKEYELVLIKRGRGRRIVGDHHARFRENDLVFLGPNTPHEWRCDEFFYQHPDGFQGEGIVIQFKDSFLGDRFFRIPENLQLRKFMHDAARGIEFYGHTKKQIAKLIIEILGSPNTDAFYKLLDIFHIFSNTSEYRILASEAYQDTDDSDIIPMHKALKYIMDNFRKPIELEELLKITNMSNSAFYNSFKKTFGLSFKEYLVRIRVGYACRLLSETDMAISEICYESGFSNISNFNRQFKKIKGETPSDFLSDFQER